MAFQLRFFNGLSLIGSAAQAVQDKGIGPAVICLATIFGFIEWSVAAFTDSVTAETYVATQGNPQDAQKDIVPAMAGAAVIKNAAPLKMFK